VTAGSVHGSGSSEAVESGDGGLPDRFLRITSDYLYRVQQEQLAMSVVTTAEFFFKWILFDLVNV
jgi:HAUS augmin-like complex subunit 4